MRVNKHIDQSKQGEQCKHVDYPTSSVSVPFSCVIARTCHVCGSFDRVRHHSVFFFAEKETKTSCCLFHGTECQRVMNYMRVQVRSDMVVECFLHECIMSLVILVSRSTAQLIA